jgi:hypothetical protein
LIALLATAVAAAQAVAPVPASVFAPPLDIPIRVVNEGSRTDGGVRRHYSSAKRVRFRRAGDGYRAEVTIEPNRPRESASGDPTAMFTAGLARLAGRTMIFHLDLQGRLTGMADQAAAWQAMLDGVAALAPTGDRAHSGRMRAMLDALGKLPPERQLATLGSMIAPLIAADIVAEGEGPPRAVRVPATSAFGIAQLDGLRVVQRLSTGEIEVTVTADGPIAVKGPAGVANGSVALETRRRIDRRTALVMSSTESVRTVLPDGSLASERTTTTRIER